MQKQFTKDGHTLTATSPREEVRLRFDGWVEVPADAAADTSAETAEEPAAEKPAAKKSTR